MLWSARNQIVELRNLFRGIHVIEIETLTGNRFLQFHAEAGIFISMFLIIANLKNNYRRDIRHPKYKFRHPKHKFRHAKYKFRHPKHTGISSDTQSISSNTQSISSDTQSVNSKLKMKGFKKTKRLF